MVSFPVPEVAAQPYWVFSFWDENWALLGGGVDFTPSPIPLAQDSAILPEQKRTSGHQRAAGIK